MATLDEATRSTLEKEILPFLNKSARTDVKSLALEYFLGMTGTPEGRQFISDGDKYLEGIISLTTDEHEAIMKDAFYSLLNLATDEDTAWRLLNMEKYPNNGINWMRLALDKEYQLADVVTGLVSNLTRSLKCAEKLVSQIAECDDISIEKIVYALCDLQHNKAAKLHYLGPILSNLTQVPYIRQEVTNEDRCIIQRLLPFTEFSASDVRRGGAIGAIRNCCFDSSYHEWLLGDDVDILPRLLLPLAGGEEFDDDDMEKLPIDLQYLSPDKKREPDPDIRLMLIETINQLLATKHGRRVMKEKNVYIIMRELHKWETAVANNQAIQNVVDILIGDEPKEGMENLHLVDIPKETEEKFKESDRELAKEIAEDENNGQK